MSSGRIARVPFVESIPTKMTAEHDRRIPGREDAVSSFASFLSRAESSPLHTDVEDLQLSRLPKEKFLRFLEKNQTEMNLRLLKSLDERGESPEPVPDTLGMLALLK
jgi:hypothetical protein